MPFSRGSGRLRGRPRGPGGQQGRGECAEPPPRLGVGLELLLGSLRLQCCVWASSVGIPLCSFQEFFRRPWGRGEFPRVLGRML